MSDVVSVVMPVWNGEDVIAAAIERVLAQTYPSIELIVVNDGSTDGTARVVRQFPDVRLMEQPNAGPAAARNTGASRAQGVYLAFIDHDDFWLPQKVEHQVSLLQERSAGFATCHLRYVLEVDPPPRWFRGPTDGSPVPGYVPSCWLMTRDTWARVGPFAVEFGHGCDTDWLARARTIGIEPVVSPECLVDYRVHATNASADSRQFTHAMTSVLRAHVQRRRERLE